MALARSAPLRGGRTQYPGLSGGGTLPHEPQLPRRPIAQGNPAPIDLQQRLHPDRLPLYPRGGRSGSSRFRLRLGQGHQQPAPAAARRHPGRARLSAQPAATARRADRGLAITGPLYRCAGGGRVWQTRS